jgi:hypothetical protein
VMKPEVSGDWCIPTTWPRIGHALLILCLLGLVPGDDWGKPGPAGVQVLIAAGMGLPLTPH